MSDELSFDEWWADFSYTFRNYNDSGFAMLERLIFDVRTFTQQKRIAFIDELLERTNLQYYACELIPLFGDQKQINEIKSRASVLINSGSIDDILPIFLKVIIKTYTIDDLPLLTKYYLNYQANLFFRIPKELYHIDKNLFLKAFTKKLLGYPIEDMCEYDGLLYLTDNIEALEFLVQNLPNELSVKLKKFALAKSKHSYVTLKPGLKERLLKLAEQIN